MQQISGRIFSGIAAGAIALAFGASGAAAEVSAMGTLQSGSAFQVRAADAEDFVSIRERDYSWFAGDTIRASRGVAVLNLNAGGGLGFYQGAEATIGTDALGRVTGEVLAGKVLYALPEDSAGMQLTAGNFTLATGSDEARRVDVALGGEFVGEIQRLEGGHVKVSVRSGELNIVDGEATRVQVSAGETLGLLDVPEAQAVQVQSAADIAITAPEEVGTREQFQVAWESAQPLEGDYLVIAPEGAPAGEFEAVVSTSEGTQLDFTAPGSAGDYEIRVIDQASGAVKSSVPLVVTGSEPAAALVGAGAAGGSGPIGGAIAVAAGGVGVFIGSQAADDDDDPEPVSP